MPRGRRKTTAEHQRDGTYRHDRHSRRLDARPPVGRLVKPRGLDKQEAWFWKTIVSSLPPECLGRIDTPALRAACVLWSKWCELSDTDDPKQLNAAVRCLDRLNAIAKQFGWTPGDRSRLQTPAVDDAIENDLFVVIP